MPNAYILVLPLQIIFNTDCLKTSSENFREDNRAAFLISISSASDNEKMLYIARAYSSGVAARYPTQEFKRLLNDSNSDKSSKITQKIIMISETFATCFGVQLQTQDVLRVAFSI